MANVFEYVLDRVSITALISNYTELKTRGRNTTGLCPFHGEKTPSFSVSEEKGLYHCFGCQKSGNAITFVCEKENLDRYDAVRFLADKFGIDISQFERKGEREDRDSKNTSREILRYAAVAYRRRLSSSKLAQEYLKKRGVDERTARLYVIGYAPDSWDEIYRLFRGRYSKHQLLDAGLIVESDRGIYDRFRNRLMFPIVDQRNRFVGFGGRVFGDDKPKYLNSSESAVFRKGELLYSLNIAKDHLPEDRQIIVTEGYMDVVGLAGKGVMNAVATLGTALTEQHAKLLARYTQNVVLCYDSDSAGQSAALKGVDVLGPHIETLKVVSLGEGLDPDEYVAKYGVDGFREKVRRALRALEYKLRRTAENYDLEDPHEKARFLFAATELIKPLQPFEKENYISFLSENFDTDPLLIRRQVGNVGIQSAAQVSTPRTREKTADAAAKKIASIEAAVAYMLADGFRSMTAAQIEQIAETEFSPDMIELLADIVGYYTEHPSDGRIDPTVFAETAGFDAAVRLEKILKRDYSRLTNGGIERLLANHRLYCLERKLESADDPLRIQQYLSEKKLLIDSLKTNYSKGAF